MAKSSSDLNVMNYGKVIGHCGIAIMWQKHLSVSIRALLNIGSDRICVIEMCFAGKEKLHIIGVYLPHKSSK